MSKTIITSIPSQEKRMHKSPQNIKFVGSRQGGLTDANMTKMASIKHKNPDYFKRQTDRKTADRYGMRKKDQDNFQMKQFSKGTVY